MWAALFRSAPVDHYDYADEDDEDEYPDDEPDTCPSPECDCGPCAERWLTCVHECGHVVAHHVLDDVFDSVWVGDDGHGGTNTLDDDDDTSGLTTEELGVFMVTTMAGGAAERALLGYMTTGVSGDYEVVQPDAHRAPLTVAEAEAEADHIVADHWDGLLEMARVLFDCGHLDYAETLGYV